MESGERMRRRGFREAVSTILSALLILFGLLGSSAAASTGLASASYDPASGTYQIQYYLENADATANPTISLDLSGAPGLISSSVTDAVYAQLASAITVTTTTPSETLPVSHLIWDSGSGILSFSYQGDPDAGDALTITLGPSPYINTLAPLSTVGIGVKTDADSAYATADLTIPPMFSAKLTSLTTASSLATLDVTVYPETQNVTTAVYVQSTDSGLGLTSTGIQATVNGSPVSGNYDATANAYVIPGVALGTSFALGLSQVPTGPASTTPYELGISTLADPAGTQVPYSLGSVRSLAVSLSNLAAGEASSYGLSFDTQSALASGDAIDVQLPTLQGPLPQGDVSLSANGASVPFAAPYFDSSGGDLVIPLSGAIAAGAEVSLTLGAYEDIPNPSPPSQSQVAVWTTGASEPATVDVGYVTTASAPGASQVSVQTATTQLGSPTRYSLTFTPTTALAGDQAQTVNITGLVWNGTPRRSDITAQQGTQALTPSYVGYAGGMLSVAFEQDLAAAAPVTMQIGALDGNAALEGAEVPGSGPLQAGVATSAGEGLTSAQPVTLGLPTYQLNASPGNGTAGAADGVSLFFGGPAATFGSSDVLTVDFSHSDMALPTGQTSPVVVQGASGAAALPSSAVTWSTASQTLTVGLAELVQSSDPSQWLSLTIGMVNGAEGSGYIVASLDGQPASVSSYDITAAPTLTGTDSTLGASDTFTLSFAPSEGQQGSATFSPDLSPFAQANMLPPTQGAQFAQPGSAPVAATITTAGLSSTLTVPETVYAGLTDQLSFTLTNPSSFTDVWASGGSQTDSPGVLLGTPDVTGTVVGPTGQPVPGAQVFLSDATNASAAPITLTADGTGQFAGSLGADTFEIDGYYDPNLQMVFNLETPILITDPSATPDTGITVQAPQANVVGTVAGTPSEVAGDAILLESSQQQYAAVSANQNGDIYGALPPGTWQAIQIVGMAGQASIDPAVTITVPSSGTATLDVAWPPANASFDLTQGGTAVSQDYLVVAPLLAGQPQQDQSIWLGPSAADGSLEGVLAPGTYEIMAVQSETSDSPIDLSLKAETFVVPASGSASTVAVAVPAPDLSLQLSGASVAYAWVEVAPESGSQSPDMSKAMWLMADRSGLVTANVPATSSTWYVVALSSPGSGGVTSLEQSFQLGATVNVTWPGSFTLSLQNAAGPVASQPVTLRETAGPTVGAEMELTTDSHGDLLLDAPPGSTWQVLSYGTPMVDVSGSAATFQVTGTDTSLTLPSADVTGSVSASGAAVGSASVSFVELGSNGLPDWSLEGSALAGASGQFQAALASGTWLVEGYWDPANGAWVDLSAQDETFTVSQGSVVGPISVAAIGPDVEGSVSDGQGGHLIGGTVVFVNTATGTGVSLNIDPSGDYSGYLPAGTWQAQAIVNPSGVEANLSDISLTTSLSLQTENLAWPTMNVSGRTLGGIGDALAYATVFLAPSADLHDPNDWLAVTSDALGRFYLSLTPGTWYLEGMSEAGGQWVPLQQSFSVPSGGSVTLTAQVPSGGLSLQLSAPDGSPAAGAWVELTPSGLGASQPFFFEADQSGAVTAAVPAGAYQVNGYWTAQGQFVAPAQAIQVGVPFAGTVTVQPTLGGVGLTVTLNGSAVTVPVDVLIAPRGGAATWYLTSVSGVLPLLPDGSYTIAGVATRASEATGLSQPFTVTGGVPSPLTLDISAAGVH